MTSKALTTMFFLLAVGVAGGALAGEPDPLDIFGQMVDERTIGGLDQDATEKLAKIMATPGLTNNSDKEHGFETNPLMNLEQECLLKAVEARTALVGLEQATADIEKWNTMLESGSMTEFEYWTHVTECQDYCAKVMVDAVNCYIDSAATRFRGIFLFDTGVGSYMPITKGDSASNGRTHDNERVMQQVVQTLKGIPTDHVLLEGRASSVGDDEANFRLSGTRSDAIRQELLGRGIPEDRIHYRWIGQGQPSYRPGLAAKYQITDKYSDFGQQTLNQSVTVYIFRPAGT